MKTRAAPVLSGKRLGEVSFRVNDEERDLLRRAAHRERIELAAWVRSVAVRAAEGVLNVERAAG